VTVSWNAVSGATSYNIYWATASGVTKLSGSKLANVTSAYAHTGRTAATTYYYIISAVNSAGEGVASAQVSAAATSVAILPTAPTSVNATGGLNQVSVSWTAVSGASSYNIYWAQASGVTKLSGTKIANVTSAYVHTGRTAATTYFYIVTAVNSAGEGLASAQVSATATSAPTAPAAPTGVSGIGGANQVSISWTAVSGATSYNIYYSASSGVTTTNGTLIANATSPRIQTGLVAGTTYYFIVTAVNSTGEGAASTQASAATNATTTPACGSCHAIPPDLGAHSFHSHPCSTCHGTGYSSTTVNALTHNNGVKDVTISIWIPATRSCAAQCHNARAW
jgi:fibronectin type 3 domain-containing protein